MQSSLRRSQHVEVLVEDCTEGHGIKRDFKFHRLVARRTRSNSIEVKDVEPAFVGRIARTRAKHRKKVRMEQDRDVREHVVLIHHHDLLIGVLGKINTLRGLRFAHARGHDLEKI